MRSMTEPSAQEIDNAVFNIATRAGDDLVLLAPPEERHFDPFSATAGFALLLLARYLQGFTGSLGKSAEAAGEATGERIKKSLKALFAGHSDVTQAEVVAAVTDASAAVRSTPDGVAAARDAARMRLVDALVDNGLPPDRAYALASRVREQTDALIGSIAQT
jgi:hypothetical protein